MMAMDWNKYPPMPEAPALPAWRDTPEREAYWKEFWNLRGTLLFSQMTGCLLTGSVYIFFSAVLICLLQGGIIPGLLLATVPTLIFIYFHEELILRIKLYRKYGFVMWKLKRPDVSKDIGKILAQRQAFDESEFRKYWPDEEHAAAALDLLKITAQYRCFHGKMLYPNDVMFLFLYGKVHRWGKEKILDPPGEWFEDVDDEYDNEVDGLSDLDCDTAFAELVEMCLDGRRKAEIKKQQKMQHRKQR